MAIRSVTNTERAIVNLLLEKASEIENDPVWDLPGDQTVATAMLMGKKIMLEAVIQGVTEILKERQESDLTPEVSDGEAV